MVAYSGDENFKHVRRKKASEGYQWQAVLNNAALMCCSTEPAARHSQLLRAAQITVALPASLPRGLADKSWWWCQGKLREKKCESVSVRRLRECTRTACQKKNHKSQWLQHTGGGWDTIQIYTYTYHQTQWGLLPSRHALCSKNTRMRMHTNTEQTHTGPCRHSNYLHRYIQNWYSELTIEKLRTDIQIFTSSTETTRVRSVRWKAQFLSVFENIFFT